MDFLSTFFMSILTSRSFVQMWIYNDGNLNCIERYHPANGQSMLTLYVDKVVGQTIDVEIRRRTSPSYFNIPQPIYTQKNVTPIRNISILLDNTDENGYFDICFYIIPDHGYMPTKHRTFIGFTSDNNKVKKIVDSIFNLGMDNGNLTN